MGLKRQNPGCRCCAGACWFFVDDFDRENTTDLSYAWHEETGDWAISGFFLVEPSNTLAQIYGTEPVPLRSAGEMRMAVDVVNPTANDIYYLYVACTDMHGAGGEWAKFTYLGSSVWRVLLSTGETQDQTFPDVNGHTPLWICIDSDGFLMAGVAGSTDEFPWSPDGATASGRYYGIGHGVVADGAVFDNFSVEELRTETVLCRVCFCHCAGYHLPKHLHLEVVDGEDRAVCMTGQVPLDWYWLAGAYGWVSDVLVVDGGASFKWRLGCGNYDPAHPFAHLGLYWDPDYYECCHANTGGCGAVHLPIEEESFCDPLFLRYGPFYLSRGELSCNACYAAGTGPPDTGYYMIEISEP